MKLLLLYRRRWGFFYLPVVAFALAAILWASTIALPLPPRSMLLIVESPDGSGMQLVARYRDKLDRLGIRLDIQTAKNAAEAIAALGGPGNQARATFASGLLSHLAPPDVEALAVVGKQPLWIFTRVPNLSNLSDLRGLHVACGDPATPTGVATALLLAHAKLTPADLRLEALDTRRATLALQNGNIDAMIEIGSKLSASVRELTHAPGIQIFGIERASAMVAREPRLTSFVLPEGSIELRGDIPPTDQSMVAAKTHLLVNKGMAPALQRVLLDTAQEVHERASFLQRAGEFPQLRDTDYPLSPTASAMAFDDRPWLERFLPYHSAQWAELLLYAIAPVLLAGILVLRWIPRLFAWRVNAVLQNYYGELKFIEAEIQPVAADRPLELRNLLTRLDAIEEQVARLDLPDRFADRWYTLREHLAAARDKLFELRAR